MFWLVARRMRNTNYPVNLVMKLSKISLENSNQATWKHIWNLNQFPNKPKTLKLLSEETSMKSSTIRAKTFWSNSTRRGVATGKKKNRCESFWDFVFQQISRAQIRRIGQEIEKRSEHRHVKKIRAKTKTKRKFSHFVLNFSAKMDATENDVPSGYDVQGFPTIYFAPKNNKENPRRYEVNFCAQEKRRKKIFTDRTFRADEKSTISSNTWLENRLNRWPVTIETARRQKARRNRQTPISKRKQNKTNSILVNRCSRSVHS